MDFVGLAKELAAAVGAFFGFQSKKVDSTEKAIAEKDANEIRKELAE